MFGLAGGCGVAVLLCCAGIGLLPVFGKAYLDKAIRPPPTPSEVQRAARRIARFDPPAGFAPKGLLLVKDPKTRKRLLQVAYYEAADGRGTLAVADVGRAASKVPLRVLFKRLELALESRGQLKRSLRLIDSKAVVVQVRGKLTEFFVNQAFDAETGERVWEISGLLAGEQGAALLYLRVPTAYPGEEEMRSFGEEEIRNFFVSLSDPQE